MKVILKNDVPEVGKKMQVLEVKDGYATNFLFKKKLAVPATDENMQALKDELAEMAAQEAALKAAAEEIKKKINKNSFTLKVKGGQGGRLYGAVTNQEIAEAVKDALGVEIDKRKIVCDAIKTVGSHPIKIKLHPQVEAEITLITETE